MGEFRMPSLGSDMEAGTLVDLVGTMGLYQISSMMVSLDQTPLANGAKPYFQATK